MSKTKQYRKILIELVVPASEFKEIRDEIAYHIDAMENNHTIYSSVISDEPSGAPGDSQEGATFSVSLNEGNLRYGDDNEIL